MSQAGVAQVIWYGAQGKITPELSEILAGKVLYHLGLLTKADATPTRSAVAEEPYEEFWAYRRDEAERMRAARRPVRHQTRPGSMTFTVLEKE